MSRIWSLAWYLTRDLFTSLLGVIPLALAVAFGMIAFEYGMDQAQFISVAGVGIGAICFVNTLLLAGRSGRASSYPLLGRLHHRAELLAALVLGGIGITVLLAIAITAANLAAQRLTLAWPSALWILPTWLVFWLFAAALALPLSILTSRQGSHLVGYVLVVGVLVANDQTSWLDSHRLSWMARLVSTILWPFGTLLSQASAGSHGRNYWIALAVTGACAFVLFSVAATLFMEKDLLWGE